MAPHAYASSFLCAGGLAALPDRDLLVLSGRLGSDRRRADRRFLATLVEIDRRGLLTKRRPVRSIEEYGARVGGVSPQTVTDVVNLGRTFSAYPRSWHLFASGAIGWTLLRTIAPMLATRSDEAWAEILTRGTKHSLARLVQAWRVATTPAPSQVLPGKDPPPPRPAPEADLHPPLAHLAPKTGISPPDPSRPGSPVPLTSTRPDAPPAAPARSAPPVPPAPPEPAPAPAAPALSPALLERLEARRREVESKLGRPLDLEGLVTALLDATAPVPSESPVVPRRILPGGRADGFVEVRVRDLATGQVLRRTRSGWTQVPDTVAALTLREGDPILDGDGLHSGALASAAKARGREVPPLVERWVWLRSGGACESPGCAHRGHHLHHRTRRAQALDHHPDRLMLLCEGCHGALHAGLLDEDGRVLPPGTVAPLAWPDRAALHHRLNSRLRPA